MRSCHLTGVILGTKGWRQMGLYRWRCCGAEAPYGWDAGQWFQQILDPLCTFHCGNQELIDWKLANLFPFFFKMVAGPFASLSLTFKEGYSLTGGLISTIQVTDQFQACSVPRDNVASTVAISSTWVSHMSSALLHSHPPVAYDNLDHSLSITQSFESCHRAISVMTTACCIWSHTDGYLFLAWVKWDLSGQKWSRG